MREALRPHDPAATIAAGGIVPVTAKLADDQRASPVTARAYPHPALDGKVVIRLEPDAVAAGTDAEMAAFGFGEPEVSAPLGKIRFRTLGFPAWALVHEPKKAAAALAVTDEVRKAKRLVAAKPGHAKTAFEAIAKKLQRGTPQFLPSFWEEVGRVVGDQGSPALAAQCFERARQAERAYKLKADPEDSDAVFVEFALLGALSAKTLSQYAKDLAKSAGGKEAYRRFRAIIVKRALGGMPPYSGMGKDLAALAKAAGLGAEEIDPITEELLEAPGVGKAPLEFWTTYREAIVRIGRERASLRARLRAIWPELRGGLEAPRKAFQSTTWLQLLEDAGALADLPDDGLGTWVSRLIRYAGNTPRVVALMREVAPRLVRLKQPIAVVAALPRRGYDLDLDLCELALELGIPLVDPEDGDDFFPESMSVDPVRVAADPRYGKKLVEAVADMIGETEHEPRMRGKAGFVIARRAWLVQRLDELEGKPLPAIANALLVLDSRTTAETFLPYPELYARLGAADIAVGLAAQLRGGLADELTWPAFEQVYATLSAAGTSPVAVGGAFPVLVMWNSVKAVALDHTGVLAEHDLVYKAKEHKPKSVWFLGGQFLVVLDPEKGWQEIAYWSSRPKDVFDFRGYLRVWSGHIPSVWTLPDGRVSLGNKAFAAGDTAIPGIHAWVSDGTDMWQRDRKTFTPYHPGRGVKTIGPPPTWLADFQRDGWSLDVRQSTLLPAPAGLTSSPLGLRDGLLGMRTRSRDKRIEGEIHVEVERIDGVAWGGWRTPFALVDWPGDHAPRPIEAIGADDDDRFIGGEGPGVELFTRTGDPLARLNETPWAARGWGLVPPAAFWDYLTPRDPAGSAALRALTLDAARALLAAALAGQDVAAAVRAKLPAVSDPVLVRGIAGHAERAAELATQLTALAAARTADSVDPGAADLLGAPGQLRKLALALAAGKPAKIADFDLDPRCWVQHGRAMVALAMSPVGEPEARRAAREMAQALAGTVLADDLSKLRLLEIEAPEDYEDPEDYETLVIHPHEGSVFAIHASDDWAIELSTDGTFRVPPPWIIEKEKKLSRGIGTAWVEALLALPDEPLPWGPSIAGTIAAASGMSPAEATLLYAGAPKVASYYKDFLGKPMRDRLGLKLGDADAARTVFKAMPRPELHTLIEAAVPDDPSQLHAGGFADGLARAWKQKFGKRAKIPADLLKDAKNHLRLGDALTTMLPAFAGEDAPFLKPDLRPLNELGTWGDEQGLDARQARDLATLLAWLFVTRPVGDPIRAGIPAVMAKLRAILDGKAIWRIDELRISDDDPKDKARRQAILDLVSGKAIAYGKDGDDECLRAHDDGALIVAAYPHNIIAGYRPAKLEGPAKRKAEQLAQAMFNVDVDPEGDPLADLRLVALLRSDGFAALAERVDDTPVKPGGFEPNPLASAPKLVAKVAKAKKLSEEAAALYLQLLALAEPTQRDVIAWNGWTAKQHAAASAELVKAKLVVEGKRERAGRSIFVKGGYTKGDRINLPTEEWKLAFYPLPRHVPVEPCHALFARAWKRVEDGDGPS